MERVDPGRSVAVLTLFRVDQVRAEGSLRIQTVLSIKGGATAVARSPFESNTCLRVLCGHTGTDTDTDTDTDIDTHTGPPQQSNR